MHKQLPTAQIFVFAFALFFAAANLAFAQHQKTVPDRTITPYHNTVTKKITPTPYPTKPSATRIPSSTPIPLPTHAVLNAVAPTFQITQTSPTPQPTTPLTTPTPTNSPVPPNNSGLLINEINMYRQSQGLGPVQTNAETCAFAATRAQEITASFSHDGFNSRISSHTLPYAQWTAVTENLAMTSNVNEVVTMWANSPGHAANMRADTPFVCVAQNGNNYAYEGMKP